MSLKIAVIILTIHISPNQHSCSVVYVHYELLYDQEQWPKLTISLASRHMSPVSLFFICMAIHHKSVHSGLPKCAFCVQIA